MASAQNVAPIFAPASAGTSILAYVFTPDTLALTSEFALLADGQLVSVVQNLKPAAMTGTAHGLVIASPKTISESTARLQSYAIEPNGTLRPVGASATVAADESLSLASDETYVYATTDEGLFGFTDGIGGLTPLPPIEETVPPPAPCNAAQASDGQCRNSGVLMLSNANAFLLQTSIAQVGEPLNELSSFVRSQGLLGAEQYFAGDSISTGIFAPTPDGSFVYALDLPSNRIFRYAMGGEGTYETNILSNGQQLSDGFVQLLVSADGSFLFAPVSDSVEAARIRVFQIDASSGELTEIAGSPFLTGEDYLVGAALDPTGHFLLAIHAYCNGSPPCLTPGKLVAMGISSTGALSVTGDVVDGEYPFAVTAVLISR
jgi:6-phosphogluconolactonase (cycloisomerase 2 family)